MTQVRCPVCGRRFDRDTSASMPFCGERCRMVDLQRWLSEDYGLPCPARDAPESPEGPSESEPEP